METNAACGKALGWLDKYSKCLKYIKQTFSCPLVFDHIGCLKVCVNDVGAGYISNYIAIQSQDIGIISMDFTISSPKKNLSNVRTFDFVVRHI